MTVTIQRAEARREDAQLQHELRGAERAAKDARVRERREYRADAREAQRQRRTAARSERRAATRQSLTEAGQRAVFVAPLLLVTGFAVYGQIDYIIDELAPRDWDLAYRLILAVAAGIAIESISNLVQFKSHEARLRGATARGAKLSRASYLIAAGVAFINYQHFCGPNLAPTPLALMFAAFSLSSPWLWSLHTSAAEDEQRAAEGTLDRAGAVFAAERWRSFPILTFRARRYSVMHNIVDPVEAWDEFMAEHRRGVTARAIERRQYRDERRTNGSLVRRGGAKPGVKAGVTGGVTAGVKAGATSTPQGGAPGGATPVRTADGADTPSAIAPAGRTSTVTRLVRRPALTQAEQIAMRDAAADWAAMQMVKTRSVTGWRSIVGATDDRSGSLLFPGLSPYYAKEAARIAKDRIQADGVPARAAR